MTRFAVFLAAVATVACPGLAAPIPDGQAEPAPYFATRLGARWTYQYPGADITLVVTGVEKKGGTRVVAVGRVRADGKVTPYEKVEVSSKGLYRLESVAYFGAMTGEGRTTWTEMVVPDVPSACMLKLPVKGCGEGNPTHRFGFRR